MKSILQTIVVVFILGFTSNIVHAQCPDSSDATLKETTDWLKSKIESCGGRNLPPSIYKVKFDSSAMTVYEIGIDENFLLKDTAVIVKMNLKDLDVKNLKVRDINKDGTRFGIQIMAKGNKMSVKSKELGTSYDFGWEMIFVSKSEPNFSKRIVKAFTHAYCVSGGSSSSTIIKEKF